MMSLPQPDVILTHESDLDGLVSGLLLQRLAEELFNIEVPLEAYHYSGWRQRSLRERSAWVCDLAFEPRLDRPDWLVIDHHPTETSPKQAQLIHDIEKSAGLLCYELCQRHGLGNTQLDRLVHLNNIADLFQNDDPDFHEANDYANLVRCYHFWNLYSLIDRRLENLLDHPLLKVMAVKRQVEDPIGYEWSKENITEISPNVGLVRTIVGNNNHIIHQLLESQSIPYSVLLTLSRRGPGSFVVSLRSRNGEALKVAEQLQGGGHANACGAMLPRSINRYEDAIDYLERILNPPHSATKPLNSLENLFEAIE